jgi:nitrogen regulatory protein PII
MKSWSVPLSLSIFLPKLKIEIAVSDENAERAIEAITRAAQTGKLGDGKIFVFRSGAGGAHTHW